MVKLLLVILSFSLGVILHALLGPSIDKAAPKDSIHVKNATQYSITVSCTHAPNFGYEFSPMKGAVLYGVDCDAAAKAFKLAH